LAYFACCSPLTSKTQIKFQQSPCGIGREQNGNETGISQSTTVFLSLLFYQYSTLIHLSITNVTQSFIHFVTNITQYSQMITPLKNNVKKSMFTEATRSHANKHTDLNKEETFSTEK
jgi:hypothetical protein